MTVERREISGYDRVRFRGPGVLKIVQDGTEGVTIHAPAWMMEKIEARVDEGRLILGYGKSRVVSLHAHKEVVSYTLHVKELGSLDCQGIATRVLVPDLDTDQLKVRLSGQGHLIFERLTADRLDARVSGTGVIQAKGDVEQQHIRIDGAGHYRASALVSDFAVVGIAGAGKADLSVSDRLDVTINGAGHVTYDGYPEVSRIISGIGKLSRRRRREKVPMSGEDHG
ncbi:MAG: DUF2807 domain-containing protein [Gammaproteobacteria bacterium]|nr:DUF2807 domain-containing protein [Gammaproteobacteria bacterium]